MNILMLNYEYPPLGGGAGNATAYILKEFAKRPDTKVTLVTSAFGEARVETIADNTTLHFLDIGKRRNLHYQSNRDLLAYMWKGYRYAKRLSALNKYDACLAFFSVPCGFIAWRLGIPYVISLQGSDVPFYNPRFRIPDKLLFKNLSKRIWRDAEAVIANSEGLRALALESAPNQEIGVIPNGVDTESFKPLESNGKEGLKIVCVARLTARKRLNLLIEAIGRINDPSVTLTLAGKGDREDDLKAQVAKLDLSDRVLFLGMVAHDDLPEVYRTHDLFVLPSVNEGMSNTVLEAMASGLPVVMTHTGGAEELVEDGKNGQLIEKDSVDSIVGSIRFYMDNPRSLREQGLNSREKAQAMSWSKVAQQYKALYLR